MFSQKLLWENHTDAVSTRFSHMVGMIHTCENILSSKRLITLYNSFFLSYLNYCCIIWGSASHSSLQRIKITKKRALKIIVGIDRWTSSDLVYERTKALSINEIFQMNCLIFLHTYRNNTLPSSLSNIFTECEGNAQCTTRSSDCYHLCPPRLKTRKRSIFFQGPFQWNHLDASFYSLWG